MPGIGRSIDESKAIWRFGCVQAGIQSFAGTTPDNAFDAEDGTIWTCRPDTSGKQVDLCQSCGRLWQTKPIESRIQTLSPDGAGLSRWNACLAEILFRSQIHHIRAMENMARRIRTDRQDVAGFGKDAEGIINSEYLLIPDSWPLIPER